MQLRLYIVWTMEDHDYVAVHTNKEEAEADYAMHGEFGCWQETDVEIGDINFVQDGEVVATVKTQEIVDPTPKGTDVIEYRYLNLDSETFHDTQQELVESLKCEGMLRAMINEEQPRQYLIAGSQGTFSGYQAIQVCRRLTNV